MTTPTSDAWFPADFYVFNGDADGICSVHQLRLAYGGNPELVTGVKRDIALLKRIESATNRRIGVMDITIEKNLPALEQLLDQNNRIIWFDHHRSDVIPNHTNFQAHINTAKSVNTSLLVNQFIEEAFQPWAIVGLFGDNIDETAYQLCHKHGFSPEQSEKLRELGQLMNYNGYGESLEDLHFTPVALVERISPFENPFDFIDQTDVLDVLRSGRESDLQRAFASPTLQENIYCLPYEKWARRVSGDFGNSLARQNPNRAHAVLVDNGKGGFVVSVRSPLTQNISAAELCKQFATGGGREAAAGINILPQEDVNRFIERFNEHYHASIASRS